MMGPERFIAKFTGQDGSLGFRKGKLYRLFFWSERGHYFVREQFSSIQCPYKTIQDFLNNWYVYKNQ